MGVSLVHVAAEFVQLTGDKINIFAGENILLSAKNRAFELLMVLRRAEWMLMVEAW